MPNEPSRSPSCAAAVASAPPPSTRGSRRSPPPAASSRWMTAIASPADDHSARGENGPTVAATSQFRFPWPLQRAGTGNGKQPSLTAGYRLAGACIRCHPLASHSLVRPPRSILPVPLPRGSRKVVAGWHVEWSVAKRRLPPPGDGPNAVIFPSRADSPGATKFFLCPNSLGEHLGRTRAPAERPQPMPSGETAPLSASTGTGWGCGGLVCSRARSTGAPGMAPIRGKCMMHEERKWFVGIDWASQDHVVTLGDGQGKKIGQRKFAHGGTGLSDMIAWLLKASGGEAGQIHVAIETPHGPIVEALLERGFNVYSINPKQLDRFRDRFTVAGAKDDSLDADVLTDSLRTDMHLFRKLTVTDPLIVELREWSRIDEELKVERVRLANRLRDQLWRYYPQMLDLATDDLAHDWFLELWEAAPTPEKAARVRETTVTRILKNYRIRRFDAAHVISELRKPALSVAQGTTEAATAHIRVVVAQLRLVNRQLADAGLQLDSFCKKLAEPV